MTRFYIYKPETGRWHDAETGATVVWHEWGEYRFSFDIRPDCSRFIIVKGQRALHLPGGGGIIDGPVQVASGLIDPECSHGAAPMCVFDGPPTEELPWLLPMMVADKWSEMRHHLEQMVPPEVRSSEEIIAEVFRRRREQGKS